eukprot:1818308-Rhodomonas_salina.1
MVLQVSQPPPIRARCLPFPGSVPRCACMRGWARGSAAADVESGCRSGRAGRKAGPARRAGGAGTAGALVLDVCREAVCLGWVHGWLRRWEHTHTGGLTGRAGRARAEGRQGRQG